jgi:hypothetical protein
MDGIMQEDRTAPAGRNRRRSCLSVLANGLLVLVWLALSIPLAWTAASAQLNTPGPVREPALGGTNYLIVAAPELVTSAKAWAEYRRSTGYIPKILTASGFDFSELRGRIQKAYSDSGRPNPFHVLLLGHAHADSSAPHAYIPPGQMETGEFAYYLSGAETIASDSLYAAQDDDLRLLPLAIGRIPARDDGEALRILARVKQYESQPPEGEGRTRVDLIASDSGFGPQFDGLVVTALEYLVTNSLPEYYQWRILYGNPDSPYYIPAGEFPGEIAARWNSGSLLAMYIGHGFMDYLGPIRSPEGTDAPAFTSQDLPLVRSADQTVVALVGCLIGEYDSPGDQPSLAELLLLQTGGAAAAYAASRITSPEGNAVIVKDLLAGMLQERIAAAGPWTQRAESAFLRPASDPAPWMLIGRRIIPELHRLSGDASQSAAPDISGEQHYNLGQHAYNLFGDPAMRIAYPVPDLDIRPVFPWLPQYAAVDFSGGGLQPGASVGVTLLAPPGRRWKNDGEGASNEQANDRTVAQKTVDTGEGGSFGGRLDLPAGVPSGRYILKAEAVDGGMTRVGSRTVYLGWPPVGVILLSVEFWWILVSLALLWNMRFLFKRLIPAKKTQSLSGYKYPAFQQRRINPAVRARL